MKNLYELGEEALENKDFKQAQKYLEQAYQEKRLFKTNYLLFKVLKAQQKHLEASQIADDYLMDYLKDDQKLAEYVSEMVYAGNVRKIETTLELMSSFMTDKEKEHFKKIFQESLADARKANDVSSLKRQLGHLGALDILSQRKALEKSGVLTIAEFEKEASKNLTDEYVHPLIRAAILDELRNLGSTKQVDYLLFTGDTQKFVPESLKELDDYLMFQRLQELLTNDIDYSEDQKPDLLAELKLKLQLLYPKLTAPFNDPQQLYNVLLQKENLMDNEKDFAKFIEQSLKQWNV